MAKGNFILGQVTGSVGDIVFWRTGGEQLSRSRNRRPANPRTTNQLVSRILLKNASLAYSMLSYNLGNQTFQGAKIGAENQRRFLSANINMLRTRLDNGEAADMNFAQRSTTTAPLNRYVVSEGNLTDPLAVITGTNIELQHTISAAGSVPTYAEVCAGLGLPAGSQLTFVTIAETNTGMLGAVYRSRIILSPADGDMSKPFISAGNINDPNPKNEYSTITAAVTFSTGKLNFPIYGNMMAVACVASSEEGGTWRYSSSQLWFNSLVYTGVLSLEDAIQSWRTDTTSTEYTRQAGLEMEGKSITAASYVFLSKGTEEGDLYEQTNILSTTSGDDVELPCDFAWNRLRVDIEGNNLDPNDIVVTGVPENIVVQKNFVNYNPDVPYKKVTTHINFAPFGNEWPTAQETEVHVKYGSLVDYEFHLIKTD